MKIGIARVLASCRMRISSIGFCDMKSGTLRAPLYDREVRDVKRRWAITQTGAGRGEYPLVRSAAAGHASRGMSKAFTKEPDGDDDELELADDAGVPAGFTNYI